MLKFKLVDQNIRNIPLNAEGISNNVFKQVCDDPDNIFVSRPSKKALDEYSENKSEDNAKKVWTNLLMDSICLLKLNDKREKLYADTSIFTFENGGINEFESFFETIRKESTYGIDELSNYFNDFIKFESVLYGTGEYYRDHIHHVLEVWGIGVGLLEGLKSIDLKLNDGFLSKREDFHFQITNDTCKSISRSEIWAMWVIIALCHDLGYPLEKASQINQKVRKIVNHFGTLNFNELNYNFDLLNSFLVEKYLNIVSSKAVLSSEHAKKCESNECNKSQIHHTEIQPKYHDKISKSLEDYQHGVLSGLLIFKKLTYFLETDYSDRNESLSCEDLRQFYIRKEMLRSICGHTCPKIYHIDLNTLSFLLIFCDELQEWDRPRFNDLLKRKDSNNQKIEIREFSTEKIEANEVTNIDVLSQYVDIDIDDGNKEFIKNNIVRRKYRTLHYLLRSAKDDNLRKIKLKWEIKFKTQGFVYEFDSTKDSRQMHQSYSGVYSKHKKLERKDDVLLYE